jgi:FkbM family methyltransferase
MSGPLTGLKWSVGCGTRFIKGTYGARELSVYKSLIKSGDVIFDIGAHVGYLSTIFERLSAPGGRVYAFEPSPLNAVFIRHHLKVNHVRNVQLIEAAVGEKNETTGFDDNHGSGRGRASKDGAVAVQMVSLDGLWAAGTLPAPNFIKMDIEGGEIGALTGAKECISSSRPVMFISTHGPEAHSFVTGYLADLDYRADLFPNSTNRIIALP